MRRILIVAAHPDDEVLGCGGTISRLTTEGQDVYIGILGEGITSRYAQRSQADPELVDALQKRSRQVAELLGAKGIFSYRLPDNRFDTIPLLDVVKIIEELVKQLGPEAIYTHHGGDLNNDHAIVHRAVLTATRPYANQSVQEVYTFEVPSSTEWGFGEFEPFQPNVFVDISATMEIKLKAMRLYEDEMRVSPHPRSLEALKVISKRWGSMSGMEAAEAFMLIRSIR